MFACWVVPNSLGCFPPKETQLDTPHTQRDSCVVERRFDFRDTTSERSSLFSTSRYFPKAS